MIKHISISDQTIAEFCQRHHIQKLAFFGSVLGEKFNEESDIDVLVEFEPEAIIGLRFITTQEELSTLLGRPVDLNTPVFLSPHFRQKVVDAAEIVYERAL